MRLGNGCNKIYGQIARLSCILLFITMVSLVKHHVWYRARVYTGLSRRKFQQHVVELSQIAVCRVVCLSKLALYMCRYILKGVYMHAEVYT